MSSVDELSAMGDRLPSLVQSEEWKATHRQIIRGARFGVFGGLLSFVGAMAAVALSLFHLPFSIVVTFAVVSLIVFGMAFLLLALLNLKMGSAGQRELLRQQRAIMAPSKEE
jgi:hypothetical protein